MLDSLPSGYLPAADFRGQGIAVNAEDAGSANQVPVVPAHNFRYEAPLELIHRLRKQYPFIDHFRTEDFESLLKLEGGFCRISAHSVLLL